MKNNRILINGLTMVITMMPLIASGQSTTKDSIRYDGRFLKLEIVKTSNDSNEVRITTNSGENRIYLADSQVVVKEATPEENIRPEFVKTSWFVLDLGLNNMLNSSDKLRMPAEYSDINIDRGRSVNFHLGVFQQGIRLDKEAKLRLVYGAGIEYNNYHFEENIDLVGNSDVLTYEMVDDVNYKKNKVVTQYVTIPLMLNFKSDPVNEGKSLNVAAGVQGGYLFRSHQKQKYIENGEKKKDKTRADYNFEDYRYGYVVQFGYGHFNLYAKYYPQPAFRKNEGPDMRTVAVGIVLLPY